MSTTSNSRDRRGGIALALILFAMAGIEARGQEQAPDAPLPAQRQPEAVRSLDDSAYRGTLELKSVRVRKLDETMKKMAGPAFVKDAREPVAVEVQTARPLPKQIRNTSPILIVNGVKYMDTWAIQPDRLVVFVDRGKLRTSNAVEAAWSGAEQTSRTRKALTFSDKVAE